MERQDVSSNPSRTRIDHRRTIMPNPPAPSRQNQKRKLVPGKIGAVDRRKRPRGLTRAIKTAIDNIIFDRCTRAEACQRAAISERALYLALEKVEVAGYWRRQVEVLRKGEEARNIQRLAEIREAANNMPAVNAIKMLMDIGEQYQAHGRGHQVSPGLAIVIVDPRGPRVVAPTIEHVIEPAPLPRFKPDKG
jgi:hypothetical protein